MQKPQTIKKNKWCKRMLVGASMLTTLYVTLGTIGCSLQNALIYPGTQLNLPATPPLIQNSVVKLEHSGENFRVHAYLYPLKVAQDAPLVVFTHGNAETCYNQGDLVQQYQAMGCHVLLVEYRGYAGTTGTPSRNALVGDSLAFIEQTQQYINRSGIFFHGRSLGGHVAAQLALELTPDGLILESTGHAISAMAWRVGMPPFLIKDAYDTADVLANHPIPVFISHGTSDEVFPLSHAQKNADKASGEVTFIQSNGMHNTTSFPWEELHIWLIEQRKHLNLKE